MKNSNFSKGNIVIYRSKDGVTEIEVCLKDQTVWLSQKQIADLFNIDRSVVTKHVRNIFKSGELNEKSNVQKMHIAGSDKPVGIYNLDVIISLGYRVNSKQATQFRIWATSVLRNYLINGYILNEKILKTQANKFNELKRSIALMKNVLDKGMLPEG